MISAQVQNFIDYLPGYCLIKDLNSKYITANPKFVKVAGFDSADRMFGISDYDLKCEAAELSEQFIMEDNLALSKGYSRYLEYLKFSDDWHIFLIEKKPWIASSGELLGTIGYAADLTETQLIDLSRFLFNCDRNFHSYKKKYQFAYAINTNNFDIRFSPRQSECLFFLLRGKTIKEIAKTLKLSPRTVEEYIIQIKLKLNCQNISELIGKAIALGYINYIPENLFNNLCGRRQSTTALAVGE